MEAVRQKSSGKMGYFLAGTNRTQGVQSEEQRRGHEKCEKQLVNAKSAPPRIAVAIGFTSDGQLSVRDRRDFSRPLTKQQQLPCLHPLACREPGRNTHPTPVPVRHRSRHPSVQSTIPPHDNLVPASLLSALPDCRSPVAPPWVRSFRMASPLRSPGVRAGTARPDDPTPPVPALHVFPSAGADADCPPTRSSFAAACRPPIA